MCLAVGCITGLPPSPGMSRRRRGWGRIPLWDVLGDSQGTEVLLGVTEPHAKVLGLTPCQALSTLSVPMFSGRKESAKHECSAVCQQALPGNSTLLSLELGAEGRPHSRMEWNCAECWGSLAGGTELTEPSCAGPHQTAINSGKMQMPQETPPVLAEPAPCTAFPHTLLSRFVTGVCSALGS